MAPATTSSGEVADREEENAPQPIGTIRQRPFNSRELQPHCFKVICAAVHFGEGLCFEQALPSRLQILITHAEQAAEQVEELHLALRNIRNHFDGTNDVEHCLQRLAPPPGALYRGWPTTVGRSA